MIVGSLWQDDNSYWGFTLIVQNPLPPAYLLHSFEGFMHGVIGHRLNIGTPIDLSVQDISRHNTSPYWAEHTQRVVKNVHLRLAYCLAIYLEPFHFWRRLPVVRGV